MTAADRNAHRPGAKTFAAIAVAGGLAAFLVSPHAPLGRLVWPETVQLNPAPAGVQVGLFTLIGAIEALAFGAGLAVLLLGREPIRRLFGPARTGLAAATHLSVFWLLWSWWLHVAMHTTSGLRPGRVLAIEYAFHASSIAAAAVLAYALSRLGAATADTSAR
jgi:hypothetical protein